MESSRTNSLKRKEVSDTEVKGSVKKRRTTLDQRVAVLKRSIALFENYLDFELDSHLSFWARFDSRTGELLRICNDEGVREQIRVFRWESIELPFFLSSGTTCIRYQIQKRLEFEGREWVHPSNAFFPRQDDVSYLFNVAAFEFTLNHIIDRERVEEITQHPVDEKLKLGTFISLESLQALTRRKRTTYPAHHLLPDPLQLIVKRAKEHIMRLGHNSEVGC